MKKKLERILLLVCVAAMLAGCLGMAAFADDGDTVSYTMKAGDTVGSVCQKLGIDFDRNSAWIKDVNGIKNWAAVPVGKVIILPKFDTLSDPTKAANIKASIVGSAATAATTGTVAGANSTIAQTAEITDADILQVTVKGGDTVIAICEKNKIDFHTNQNWIKEANSIANWNNIKVGKVLYLPKFDTTKDPTKANALMNSIRAKNGVPAVPANGTGGNTNGNTNGTIPTNIGGNTVAGDTISGYLVYHKMQAGETAYSVCNALGVNFEENSEAIKTMSGVTNWNKLAVGTTLVIPSKVAPAGDTYVSIVCHTVAAGETVGSICAAHGIDYASNIDRLKGLNNTNNLGVIRAGQKFYLPISAGASGASGTTPAAAGGSSATNQQTVHGSFVLLVNGAQASNVAAGQTVTISATPDAGYVVDTVTVVKTGTNEAVPVSNMTFTMPNVPVTVSVTFRAA